MSVGVLGTALSGLNAYQLALSTTSNNISNASTAGYNVQHAEFGTQTEQFTGSGYLGNGVQVNTIARNYDQFLTGQVRSSTSAYIGSNTYYTLASQIDNMIADQNTGMTSAMNSFFSAVNGVSNDPTSIPARQVLLSNGKALAERFNGIANTFSGLTTQVNGNLNASVSQLNGYANTIAQLNTQIVAASHNGAGQPPNALLDQRDALLNKIAEQANVAVVNQTDGSINVYIGQGQPLVLGSNPSTLQVQASATDSNHMSITLNGQDVSSKLSGGAIAGNLQFRDQVLDPAQQQLGLLATGLATKVNTQHQAGTDLNSVAGLAFFNLGSPAVQVEGAYSDQNLVVSAAFSAPTSANIATMGSAYKLTVTATAPATAYSLTNLSNNTTTAGLSAATLATTAAANGFSISFSGGALTVGDTFQISPTYNAAGSIQLNPNLTDPKQIAAATGAAGLPGDNSNALALATLQTQTPMMNGSSSFSQVYSQLVTTVGTNTNAAKISSTAQNSVLQNATSAQQSVSGVNLNEEAANLIQFQNAYQASAKTVSVAQSLFSAILGAVG